MTFDLFTATKCPECGSRNIRRSITAARITELDDPKQPHWVRRKTGDVLVYGKLRSHLELTDAGHFRCKDCGFEVVP